MEKLLLSKRRILFLLLCIFMLCNKSLAQPVADGDPCPGFETFTDPRDGNIYTTVVIGNQCWIRENMRYIPYLDPLYASLQIYNWTMHYNYGSPLPQFYAVGYWAMEHNDSLYPHYGAFYNRNSSRDACPAGWYLPMEQDWDQMVDYLAQAYGLTNNPDDINGIGNALKSCRQLNSPLSGECNTPEHPRWDSFLHYGNDRFSFSALPAGFADWDWSEKPGSSTWWWTTEGGISISGWKGNIEFSTKLIASVRCMKEIQPASPLFQLDVRVDPPGSGQAEGSGSHRAGRKLSMRAIPGECYVFRHWTIGEKIISIDPSFVFEMPHENVIIQASFISLQGVKDGDPCPGYEVVTDPRDGNVYTTTLIGSQCWLRENARYIPEQGFGNNPNPPLPQEHLDYYGGLYSWEASQEACPAGWQMAGEPQWDRLIHYLVDEYGYTTENVAFALRSCRQVNSPLGGDCNTREHPRWDENEDYGTDIFNLSLLPAGITAFLTPPVFGGMGANASFWTSTQGFTPYRIHKVTSVGLGTIITQSSQGDSRMSVRCMREAGLRPAARTLNLLSDPPHAGTVLSSGNYHPGQMVAVHAMPEPGFIFSHWSQGDGLLWDSQQTTTWLEMPNHDLELTAVFESAVSSKPITPDSPLRIYPNPASNELWVELPAGEYETVLLLNLQGQLIQQIFPSGNTPVRFHTAHLPAGIYLITIRGRNSSQVHRVMIRK